MPNVMPKTSFDYTSLSTFNTCHRKYDYRINRGYVKKITAMPLEFGKCIHSSLNEWYTTHDIERTVEVFNSSYKEDLTIDDKRTNKLGEWILRNYHKQYIDQPWELVHSEMTFEVPLVDGIKFIGRIDKIIKWGDVLWIVDHKTMSSLGAQFHYMTEPSLQFPGYVWAAQKMGYDVKGFILDAILVAKGLMSDVTTGAKKSYSLTPLARYDVYYKEEHLKEWYETTTSTIKDIKHCEDSDVWYPNFDSCVHYGECMYRSVCKNEVGVRQRILDADYEVDFWDPLKKDE